MQRILLCGLLVVTNTFLSSMASSLIAKHQLVVVEAEGEALIRLTHYDDSDAAFKQPNELKFTITSLPADGFLYQLSSVYSKYGYEPKVGYKITSAGTEITGSDHRLVYRRPQPDSTHTSKWSTFEFEVSNGYGTSEKGTITLVSTSGTLESSDFLFGSEGWTVVGNKALSSSVAFESLSRGPSLNHYIMAHDDEINVKTSASTDSALWYFKAPSKFLYDKGISYGGDIKFTLGAFSGDFSMPHDGDIAAVKLVCNDCVGPSGPGITLIYPISAMKESFSGDIKAFEIPLLEGRGWMKDPQNTLAAWIPASQCDMVQVLYRLTDMQILGDWTKRHESIALDNVSFTVTRTSVPLCAQKLPDASLCTC